MIQLLNCPEIKEVKDILDKKLYNNDINIVDIIMDYVIETCEKCDGKTTDFLGCLEYGYISDVCSSCDEDKIEKVCDECKILYSCYGCDEKICEMCCDPKKCGECDREFCDTCACEGLLVCEECEIWYCCLPVYKIVGHSEVIYQCMKCVKNSIIYPSY